MKTLAWCESRCDEWLDGAVSELKNRSFDEREISDPKSTLATLKLAGITRLAIDKNDSGYGLTARELAQVSVTLGAIAPSAAIAINMHTFSVASLRALYDVDPNVWAMLEAVATQSLFMASGFAEGRHGQSVVNPTMRGESVEGGYRLYGTKKPCSLAYSMDILSASFSLDHDDTRYGVALVPATDPAVSVESFWHTPVLAGAESHAVTLSGAYVPVQAVVSVPRAAGSDVNVQEIGFAWFELLMSAAYLGMLDRLVELGLARAHLNSSQVAAQAAMLPAVYEAVFSLADRVQSGVTGEVLGISLSVRKLCQEVIALIVPNCLDDIGGIGFIKDSETWYLSCAVQCLRFHPPSLSRISASDNSSIYERMSIQIN